jgi:glycosyltransferase involved in cell wall biosynthesis
MRIALIAPLVTAIREPQRGGSQSIVADLAAGLTSRGHLVHVYAASGSAIPDATVIDTGVDSGSLAGLLYRADRPSSADLAVGEAAFARVYRAVTQVPYDLVHNHAFDPPAVRSAAALPLPALHTLHLPPDPMMAAVIHDALESEHPPMVATVSASQTAAWRAWIPVDAVLPNGVPIDRIPWSADGDQRVLFAGRLSPEKGAGDAIAIAKQAGIPIDLYGDPYDAGYAAALFSAHRDDASVTFHGGIPRAELWQIMSRARAVLCPSKWEEPFGMVAAEAQATGTPVIAYRRGALPEVIVDGWSGFIVDADDIDGAASALARVQSIDRKECRRHAEANLSLDASIAAHERVYARLTAPLPNRAPTLPSPASGGGDFNG